MAAIFLLLAAASGYLTWLMGKAGDSGQWLFGVFTLFFLALAVAPLLPKPKPKPPTATTSTRFVPHWFMLLAMLVIIVSVLAAIIRAIRSL